MFKLFDDRPRSREGVILPYQGREGRTQADVIYATLTQYWERSSFRLPNQHLLIQLLRTLDYSVDTPLTKVLENLDARWFNVARAFQITSAVNYGKPHKGVFYSSNDNKVTEYVIALTLWDIDPFDPLNSWANVSPFKVLRHPANDFRWLLPAGHGQEHLKDYAVVAIDIRLLAMQYNLFKKEQIRLHQDKAVISSGAFLTNVALPKMYPSHIDEVMWNQCMAFANLVSYKTPKQWLPISIPDITNHVKPMVKTAVGRIEDSRRHYVQSLTALPTLFAENAMQALVLPEIPRTRQSNWITILSRWRHVQNLIDLQGRKGQSVNTPYLADLKYTLRVFLNEKAHRNFQNDALEEQFEDWAQRFI